MEIVYANELFPTRVQKSIFLAGPTPRSEGAVSWRSQAIALLGLLGYDGHVFIPEPRSGKWEHEYDRQVEWEEEGLNRADCIVFWVPRDLDGTAPEGNGSPMMALTTNVEWGMWKNSGKVVWGAPDWAKHTRYQQYYSNKLGVPQAQTLKETLELAIQKIGDGAERQDGECCVPVHIWKRKDFQHWYHAQREAGNRLDGARVQWAFFPKPGRMFCYVVHVNVHIAAEARNKVNEFVLLRPDVSSVLLYTTPSLDEDPLLDTKVVLVREFRSPVNNDQAFVYELPGGSSVNELENPLGVASSEVEEEVGLKLDHTRFFRHETRQMVSTLSAHRSALFSCRLTPQEMALLAADRQPHGNFETDSEMTWIEVRTVRQIIEENLVDWSTLGMIFRLLNY